MGLFRGSGAAEAASAPSASVSRPTRFRQVVTLEAVPDERGPGQTASLRRAIGAQFYGGTVVGHEGGSPERSLTGYVQARPSPVAAAMGAVAHQQFSPPANSEFPDTVGINPAIDPYNALLFARMNRS